MRSAEQTAHQRSQDLLPPGPQKVVLDVCPAGIRYLASGRLCFYDLGPGQTGRSQCGADGGDHRAAERDRDERAGRAGAKKRQRI